METVIVERTFDEPIEFEAVAEMEQEAKWCLEARNVRPVLSYLSNDRKRMICVYEAPDAEAVREVNRQSGIPFDLAWSGTRFGA